MSSRVEALELQNRQHFDRFSTQTCPDTDVSSIRTVKGPNVNRSGEISRQLDSVSPSSCFTGSSVCDYVESLQKSWVYRRSNALDPSRLSIYSRDGRSMTWSTFSGISCEEISQISVIGLPIHIEEVYNPRRVSQTWTADKLVHSKPNAPVSYYKVDKNKQALLFMPSEVSLSWACNLHQYMPDRPCKVCGDQISIDGYVFEVISGGDERKEEDWRFWCHDCFRCHECNAHPNPNAKLGLLQGELPLCEICYTSCSTCGSEMVGRYIKFRLRPHVSVEEYQCEACWMTCLTCSYCEREIAGGDYARTGSETFCMDCHNTLMARRRKTEDSKPGALLTSLDLPVILT